MNNAEHRPGTHITVACNDGHSHPAELVSLPMYDQQAEIPRGKRVDIPDRK